MIDVRNLDIVKLSMIRNDVIRSVILDSYYEFFKEFWPQVSSEDFIDNWHIKIVCDELQKIGELVINREPKEYDLVINVPPGSSKSTMATVLFPVWLWCKDATLQIISTSHTGSLSYKHSTDSREVFDSNKFKIIFGNKIQIKRNEDSKGFYRNTEGGFRIATSTGASIIGQHAHLILIDDPIDPDGVKSEVVMESVNEYINKTLSRRKVSQENTPMILIMQRLHEGDPTGDWLEKARKQGKRVRHICLPATTDGEVLPADLSSHYTKGLFDINRLPQKVLDDTKIELGSMEFAGQYLQSPKATEGNKIKRAWFQYCDEKELPSYLNLDLWIDGAYTKSTSNDPSGLMVTGFDPSTKKLYIKHAYSAFLEMPELLKWIDEYSDLQGLNGYSRVFIEPKASGKTLVQMLKERTILSAVEIKSHLINEGKEARIQIASPKYEAGRIVHVKGGWIDDYEYQITTFPRAKHDEYVDLIGYAIYHYYHDNEGNLPTML